MADDALVVNRQAELPDLIEKALHVARQRYVVAWDQWNRAEGTMATEPNINNYNVKALLTALGVGKPEPVLAGDLEQALYYMRHHIKETRYAAPGVAASLTLCADRIERAIGGDRD